MVINIIVLVFFLFSLYFTFKYRFTQFKALKISNNAIKNDQSKSAYQTFLVSLASHMGSGNIVGIASSLIVGGIGSIFWMWIYAIFSSIFSLMENTIAQKYKVIINGEVRGGSSFYISKGLNKKVIATIIAIFLILSNTIFFQPLQVNTISETLLISCNIPKYVTFIALTLFTIFVIFRGTKKIVRFSEFIVPIMSIGYIALGLVLIIFNYQFIPVIFKNIIDDAFNMESIIGGSIFVGMRKSLFSHEAGLGTTPTISVMSNVKKPIEQGYISCLGIFIDTILMCSITGFIVLIYSSDANFTNFKGCDLIIEIFANIFGSFGRFLGSFFLIAFALATVVSLYYLGEGNLLFLVLNKKDKTKKVYILAFKLLFIIGIFLGVFTNNKSIWMYVDIGIILLGMVNIYAIIKLKKDFENELKRL